jgi:arylformamidase
MTTPFDAPDWRGMSQEDRNLGLNNGVAVPGSADMVAGWERLSAEMRARHSGHLDLRFGPRERNRIDFLKAADGGPTAQLPALGGDPDRIVASGWSAGGHLTSMALSHPRIKAGMAISGIYDLEPIRHSYLNVKLGLDGPASRRNSPMMQSGGAMKPLSLVVGSAELPLLRKQTADFAGHRAQYGLPVTYEEILGANHFTIMDELLSPSGRITALIRQLFEQTKTSS